MGDKAKNGKGDGQAVLPMAILDVVSVMEVALDISQQRTLNSNVDGN